MCARRLTEDRLIEIEAITEFKTSSAHTIHLQAVALGECAAEIRRCWRLIAELEAATEAVPAKEQSADAHPE